MTKKDKDSEQNFIDELTKIKEKMVDEIIPDSFIESLEPLVMEAFRKQAIEYTPANIKAFAAGQDFTIFALMQKKIEIPHAIILANMAVTKIHKKREAALKSIAHL